MKEPLPSPYLEIIINTSHIRHNFRILQRLCAPAEIAAVLKADAYGLGMIEMVSLLAKEKCPHFFVAYLNEALLLRERFQDITISVLNGPFEGELPVYQQYNIIPILNTVTQVRDFSAFCKRGTPFSAIIQLETGFSRLGLDENDLTTLHQENLFDFPIGMIISHISCADEPNHPHNTQQIQTFERMTKLFPANTPKSLLASSGIAQHATAYYNMVRAGIALYGYHLPNMYKDQFKPAITIRSRILQIKWIKKGSTVGYNARYTASQDTKIALVATGYADGYARALGEHGTCFFKGEALPIIGNISMDSFAIDITHLSHNLKEGDFVELVNESYTIDNLTHNTSQSSYEFLTSLSKRCQRVYTAS